MIELYIEINLIIFINRSITMRIMSFSNIDFDIDPKLFMPIDSQNYPGIDNEYNYSANE